jgi:hypothetical protein
MTPDVARQLIRDRVEKGSLPRDRTIELWHARGFGQTCDGCGLAITTTDWMCLICADDWRAIRLHEECLVLWEEERFTRIPGSTSYLPVSTSPTPPAV